MLMKGMKSVAKPINYNRARKITIKNAQIRNCLGIDYNRFKLVLEHPGKVYIKSRFD